jgi:hypothetical protein
MHAIPLARRGFKVVAMDTCDLLLEDLEKRRGSLPIRTVHANLRDFRADIAAPLDLIVCMGDTLTHLPSRTAVDSLIADAAASLNRGGVFMATFRDYVSAPLEGDARFILVRSDEQRILTCCLEYADTTVMVHDLLHQREGGSWRLHVGSYQKLRLSPAWVVDRLSALSLTVSCAQAAGGMIRIIAVKP